MRELTFSEVERLECEGAEAGVPFTLDEDAFRIFYDRTARPLWAYLSRLTGDRALADDLLQETYYRFLRSAAVLESEAHGRNYLFRIATNLARDARRRHATRRERQLDGVPGWPADAHDARTGWPGGRHDAASAPHEGLHRAWTRLTPRERALLWLAYAQGSPHRDIGQTLGVKTGSIKVLLFRARRKLAALLRTSADERSTS